MLLRMRGVRCLVLAVVLLVLVPSSASAGTLVFTSTTCRDVVGCISLRVVGDDGTGLRELSVGDARSPAWSHDGSRIVYEDGRSLRSIRADGSDDRSVFNSGRASAGAPDWSPIEDLIAFPHSVGIGPSDIAVIRSDGSGMRTVAGGPGNEDSVRFSPDGRRLEYYRSAGFFGGQESGLYSIELDGTGERRLTLGEGVYLPTPSPDGRYLAYIRGDTVWTVRADGTRARAWTPPGGFSDGPLRWAPEGPKLYFRYSAEAGPVYSDTTIHVADMRRPDAGAQRLLAGTRNDLWLDWTGPSSAPAPADDTPPGVLLLDTRRTSAATTSAGRRAGRVISKRRSLMFAFDATGIQSVRMAVAKERGRGRSRRCRFLGARGFGRARRCNRPVFRAIRSGAAFTERLERLRTGRYRMAFKTRDVIGNQQRRPRLARVKLRP